MSDPARASVTTPLPALHGWQAFTLRPAGTARALLNALRREGAEATNLALVRLRPGAPDALAAMVADIDGNEYWLFTSPAAVRHALRLAGRLQLPLSSALVAAAAGARLFAPGPGTARALARAGIVPVQVPAQRYDSEGLLDLPALAAPLTGTLALVGAPGGRGLLQATLADRGAQLRLVPVYQRIPARPQAAALARLRHAARPLLLASSAELLARLPQVLDGAAFEHLLDCGRLVVASERLAGAARQLGFAAPVIAGSARPDDLVAAARRLVLAG